MPRNLLYDQSCPHYDDPGWTQILSETKLGPHRQHFYQLDKRDQAWTHVRLDIFPGEPLSPHSLEISYPTDTGFYTTIRRRSETLEIVRSSRF